MVKIAMIALGCIAIVIVGILAYAATKPDTFRVARSITIDAPPDTIFPLIDDYRRWPAWSPYEDKDPQMKRAFGAVVSGRGATYAWEGDSNVGAGNMTIVDTIRDRKVAIRLNMVKPISASNDVVFDLAPQRQGTTVTWAMSGAVPYIAKIMHVFFDVDKMVGGDFETGLRRLKAAAEKGGA
jgi:hypothetical protein